MKTKYLAFAAAVALLAGCSNDEEFVPTDNLKDTPITIRSAGVTEPVSARAISDNLLTDNGVTLGLYVADESYSDDRYTADHEQYVAGQDGKWSFSTTGKDTRQLLFNGHGFDWIAYSPYSIEDGTASTYLYQSTVFSVPTDGNYGGGSTSDETVATVSGSRYDLLWGKGTSGTSTVELSLSHTLTMLTVNITKLGSEIANETTVDEIKIGGTFPTGSLNLTEAESAAGVVTIPEGNTVAPAEITAMKLATPNYVCEPDAEGNPVKTDRQHVASFEALVIPQTAALTLTVTLSNGKVYSTTLAGREFNSGYHYSITLQVGQDAANLGGITADPWQSDNGGNLDTD